jgi:hypothetical protein
MTKKKFKIGFSNIGGIYIGKNIQSVFHEHYAISILVSFGEAFKLITAGQKEDLFNLQLSRKT